jgi:hypothetical protein
MQDDLQKFPKPEKEMLANISADAIKYIKYYTLPFKYGNEPFVHVMLFFAHNQTSSINNALLKIMLTEIYEEKIRGKFAL